MGEGLWGAWGGSSARREEQKTAEGCGMEEGSEKTGRREIQMTLS